MDVAAFDAKLQRVVQGLNPAILARIAGAEMVRSTMSVAPVLTGTLRRSIRINSISTSGTKGTATYGPHVVYDRIQDQGGVITVRTRRVLYSRQLDKFFGRSVRMPGQHYMARGAQAGEPRVTQAMRQYLDGLMNG